MPIVPYIPEDSASFYADYYNAQRGNGLSVPVFRGKSVMPGNGIGSIFSGLFRSAMPLLKTGAKKLLSTGADVLSDVVSGENLKQSAKSRFKNTGKELMSDVRVRILYLINLFLY
jgi:hypothetical protein